MNNKDSVSDVRDTSIDELIEEYGRLRDNADHLPVDNPQCIELELLYMLAEKVFNGKRIS